MPEARRPVELKASAEPVKLGSFLFSLVEPHRGYEVAYNRWYERDHFYSGCMIGPYNFAGGRFVATADLKSMRDPDLVELTGEAHRGSYVALYWILQGGGTTWGRWARDQVMALHEAGRMFEHRDHVHTQLYDYRWSVNGEEEGVPAELALDHPFSCMVAEFVDLETEEDLFREAMGGFLGASLPDALVIAARPQEMPVGAPGVERREATRDRLLLLWFLEQQAAEVWDRLSAHREGVESKGQARVVALLPFVPTVPGTDTYTDCLWVD